MLRPKANEGTPLLAPSFTPGGSRRISSFTSKSTGPGLYTPRRSSISSSGSTRLEKLYDLPENAISNSLAVFSMVNCLVGSGILGLPYAFAKGGWVTLALLAFTTVGTAYTAKILARSLETVARRQRKRAAGSQGGLDITYAALARETFGSSFEMLVNVSLFLELWGGGCARILLQGSNLHKLFPSMTTLHWMVAVTVVLLPSLFFGMRYLSYMSFLGMTSSVLLVAVVFISGLVKGPVHDTVAYRLEGLPISFGIILFTFSGHAVFPNIFRSMEDKPHYSRMVDIAFAIVLVFYAGLSVIGYQYFGAHVDSQITLSLPAGFLPKVAIVTVVLNTMLSFALLLSAPVEMVETVLGMSEKDDPKEMECDGPAVNLHGSLQLVPEESSIPASRNLIRGLIRVLLLLGNLGVAIELPSFGLLSSLIGALCTMGMSFVYPCMIYLRLHHYDIEKPMRQRQGLPLMTLVWNYFIIIVGICGAVIGVFSVLADARRRYGGIH